MNWKKESEQFNKAAAYYDQYRPTYPKEIISFLQKETKLMPGNKILEIGAGSGKATELLSKYGYQITCIEPGPDLVKIGNEKFKDNSISFVQKRYEDFVTNEKYDLIFAAQSFHWVPVYERYQKSFELLKENGYLALIWNMYLITDSPFDQELLRISSKYGGFADFLTIDECQKRIESIKSEIKESALFSKPIVKLVNWNIDYSADDYIGFIQTGNSFLKNTNEDKEKAYAEIRLLAEKNDSIIKRPFIFTLYLAKRVSR